MCGIAPNLDSAAVGAIAQSAIMVIGLYQPLVLLAPIPVNRSEGLATREAPSVLVHQTKCGLLLTYWALNVMTMVQLQSLEMSRPFMRREEPLTASPQVILWTVTPHI